MVMAVACVRSRQAAQSLPATLGGNEPIGVAGGEPVSGEIDFIDT